MNAAAAVHCPGCKRVVDESNWRGDQGCRCGHCQADYEVVAFPAFRARRSPPKPQAVRVADDSTCFFHQTNQAEKVCDGCGRFLCTVCSIPVGSRTVCPKCLEARDTNDQAPARRVVYSSVAVSLALVPLLFWPLTLLTSPAALGVIVVGWNKPGSLVHGRKRWRFIVAGVIAGLQVAGWSWLFVTLIRDALR